MSGYLEAAERVGAWLESVAKPQPEGWIWPVAPGAYDDEATPSLAWGTAAPTLFFVEAYRTTGDDRWHAGAVEGASWLSHHIEEAAGLARGCGLFTGISGWALVLDELAAAEAHHGAADGGARWRAAARQAIDTVLTRAEVDEAAGPRAPRSWHGLTEVLWGTAGIGCLLLDRGVDHVGDRATDAAVGAGDWLLAEAVPVEGGLQWRLGPGYDRDGRDPRFPNYAHGTAGIGFFLARLVEVTGEARFLEAAQQAAGWLLAIGRAEGDTFAVCQEPTNWPDQYPFGWCHGPMGLAWFFRQLAISDQSRAGEWHDWMRRCARTTRTSGIPERREPGFWDNVGRCCGSAGVAEVFLDLHTLGADPDDLGFATTLVDDLLTHAITDDTGMRWSNIEFRKEPSDLPPETTYFQGAPGVGSTLLRLHRHLQGDPWTVRWPHAPSFSPTREMPRSGHSAQVGTAARACGICHRY